MSKSSLNRREFLRGAFAQLTQTEDSQSVVEDIRDITKESLGKPEVQFSPAEIDKMASEIAKEFTFNSSRRKGSCAMKGEIYSSTGFLSIVQIPLIRKTKQLQRIANNNDAAWEVYRKYADQVINAIIEKISLKTYKDECLKPEDIKMLHCMLAATGARSTLKLNYDNILKEPKVEMNIANEQIIEILESLAGKFAKFQLYIERLNKPPKYLMNRYRKYKKSDQYYSQCIKGTKTQAESQECYVKLHPTVDRAEEKYMKSLASYLDERNKWSADTSLVEWIFECKEKYGPDFLKMVSDLFADFEKRLKAKAEELSKA